MEYDGRGNLRFATNDESVANPVSEWADRGGGVTPPKCTEDLPTESFGHLLCATRQAKVPEIAPTAFSTEHMQEESEERDKETSFDLVGERGGHWRRCHRWFGT